MSSVDMCEHDWPGSGCRECFPKQGGVGYRFDVCMSPGDPAGDEQPNPCGDPNMSKRVVFIRNAKIVPAETIWPGRCMKGDIVLQGELVSDHPVLGSDVGAPIRTSLIVTQDLAARRVETQNTIYEVVN
jgi:hypothetical protein